MKRLFVLAGLLLCLLTPAMAPAVSAYDPLDSACKASGANSPSGSVACTGRTGENPVTGQNGILHKVTVVIAILAGAAAVIVIIIAGIQYMTSGGDPQKAASARSAIIGAIIGLIIIASAQGIITFVLSKV